MTGCGGCTCNWAAPQQDQPERVTEMLRLLDRASRYRDQTPGRGSITGRLHALRTAALARENGHDQETVFVGLVHDLARPLNDVHHGEIMAEMVRDRVSPDAYQVLRTHGQYQAAIVHQQPFPEPDGLTRHAQTTAAFLAAYEAASFTPHYTGPELSMRQARDLILAVLGDHE